MSAGVVRTIFVAINPTGNAVQVTLPIEDLKTAPKALWGYENAFYPDRNGWRIQLPPASGGIYEKE
jgi:hypothetical protein